VETISGVVFGEVGGKKLSADIYRPAGAGPFPAVLCVHGGAWLAGHRLEMYGIGQALARHGYAAVSIDYRLAPADRFPAQLDDCRTAFDWMRREGAAYKIDPNRIGAWGYSAGAHLVTLLALSQLPSRPGLKAAGDSHRIRAVVAGGTPCDFRKVLPDDPTYAFWLGGTRREKPDLYVAASPAQFVSSDDPPVFLYHGENDMLVSLHLVRLMVVQLKKDQVPVELYTRPNAGHLQTFFDGAAVNKGIDFLDKNLKRGG
jgi:acetyl esterase/lipase